MADTTQQYEFDQEFQERICAMFARDSVFAMRVKDLVKPEFFTTDALRATVGIIGEHVEKYKCAPELQLMPMLIRRAKDNKRIREDVVPDIVAIVRRMVGIKMSNFDFVVDEVAQFARHQAMEHAIIESVALLEKGKFEDISERMKDALSVAPAEEGEDYDYFEEIDNRTQVREDIRLGKAVKRGITSGYSDIDRYLYHAGWGRKELSCIMGPAKSGKSLSLGDFCKNATMAGYKVLYISLEVAKEIIADRIDAALSDTMMRELNNDNAKVQAEIRKMEAKAKAKGGVFKMRDFPSGMFKASRLRQLLDDFRADGLSFDLVAVDYADIMAPEFRNDDYREALRQIYIDLRGIASEYNLAMLTATQTNRDGAKANTAKATDVGDDWNKVRTVDILIGINATEDEKIAGEARLHWAVSRNTEDGFSLRIKQDRQKMQFLTKVVGREH